MRNELGECTCSKSYDNVVAAVPSTIEAAAGENAACLLASTHR